MGRDLFMPNPAARPEGGIRLLEAQGGSRVHWRTGMGRSFEAPDELMMTAATTGQAGIGPVPMMPQISWPSMGHAQGHPGTAGNLGRASHALRHNTAACAHGGGAGSSFTPAPLSQAHYAAAALAVLQPNRGLRIQDLSAPIASPLAPSRVRGGDMVNFHSSPQARPSSAQASASLPNPISMESQLVTLEDRNQRPRPSPTPWGGAMMDGPDLSPSPVHGADASPCDANSIVLDALDVEDAVDFLPFPFEQALHTLSGLPLPPDFQLPE